MPQLHLYVSDETAAQLRADAERAGLSTSRHLARLIADATRPTWPEGYFDAVCGSCPDFPYPVRERAEQAAPLELERG